VVQYLEVKDIDFTSARVEKRKFDEMLEDSEDNSAAAISKSGASLKWKVFSVI